MPPHCVLVTGTNCFGPAEQAASVALELSFSLAPSCLVLQTATCFLRFAPLQIHPRACPCLILASAVAGHCVCHLRHPAQRRCASPLQTYPSRGTVPRLMGPITSVRRPALAHLPSRAGRGNLDQWNIVYLVCIEYQTSILLVDYRNQTESPLYSERVANFSLVYCIILQCDDAPRCVLSACDLSVCDYQTPVKHVREPKRCSPTSYTLPRSPLR